MIETIRSGIILLIVGYLLGVITNRMKLPSLIGMILAGVIIGPYQLNFLSEGFLSYSTTIRQVALVIILLRAGLALEMNDFKNTKLSVVLMSFVPALFEIVTITLGAMVLFSFSMLDGLLLATVVAAVSPAVIVPKMIKIMDEGYGQTKKIPQLILAAASLDDVVVLVLFSAVLSLNQTNTLNWMSFLEIPVSIGFALGVGILVGKIMSMIIKKIHWIFQLMIFFLLSFIFFEIEVRMVFSALVAVMSCAMSFRYFLPAEALVLKEKLTKLWKVAEIFLFTLVGATVNISILQLVGMSAALLLMIGLLFRSIGVYFSLHPLSWSKKEKLFCVISYWPKATVQAAIGALPLAYHLSSGSIILAISVLAILITAPLGAIGIEKTYSRWLKKANEI